MAASHHAFFVRKNHNIDHDPQGQHCNLNNDVLDCETPWMGDPVLIRTQVNSLKHKLYTIDCSISVLKNNGEASYRTKLSLET